MTYKDLQELPEGVPENPKIGDYFVQGRLIDQKADKVKNGDRLVYYQITNVKKTDYGINVEYKEINDILEY